MLPVPAIRVDLHCALPCLPCCDARLCSKSGLVPAEVDLALTTFTGLLKNPEGGMSFAPSEPTSGFRNRTP